MAIVLFTDFGASDIYVGQVKAVLHRLAPQVPVIDLTNELAPYDVHAAAHLLDALKDSFAPSSVFLCVVDPGVGTARAAVVLEADERRYVGPDNGLLSVVASRAASASVSEIAWRPERIADSFHGRDLFAPIAALLAARALPADWLRPAARLQTVFGAGDLRQIVYVDHYGNACTGIRASHAPQDGLLVAGGRPVVRARVFAEAPPGRLLWHANSHGLVEIAANLGNAAQMLGLKVGDPVRWAS